MVIELLILKERNKMEEQRNVSDIELIISLLEEFPDARFREWKKVIQHGENWMVPLLLRIQEVTEECQMYLMDSDVSLEQCKSVIRGVFSTTSLTSWSPLQKKKLYSWYQALLNQSKDSPQKISSSSPSMTTTFTSSMDAPIAPGAADATSSNSSTARLTLRERMRLGACLPTNHVQTGTMSCVISVAEGGNCFTSKWDSPIDQKLFEMRMWKREDVIGKSKEVCTDVHVR